MVAKFGEESVMISSSICPILGFCAYSGTGKTTLIKHLIARLRQQGKNIGVIKHAHHSFDTDTPGKDSFELRKAGARVTVVSSSQRYALLRENFGDNEVGLPRLIDVLTHNTPHLDLIIVEGFKREDIPKIELHRKELGKPPYFPHDNNIIAVASNDSSLLAAPLPTLPLDEIDHIANFIFEYMDANRKQPG